MDALANFAYGIVATAPSPATSGTSLVLQTGQGASFPAAPFDVTMWPASAIPLNSNAEIARCTVISGDTLTITRAQYGTAAQTVAIGFQVCQSVDKNLLGQLLPLSGGTMSGALDMGSNQIHHLTAGVALTDAANVGQIVPFPAPGAVNLIGHSQLGATNLGIPEPQAQARYTGSRVAAVLNATPDSVKQMMKAGGSLFVNLNSIADGCDWGSARQRLLPSGAIGTTARGAVSGTEAYTLTGQFNPPLPGTSHATSVIFNGINDIPLAYSSGFTATGTAGTLTTSGASSGANLTAGNAYLSGRGILPGDFIVNNAGAAVRVINGFSTYAEVATVTFTAGQTVITFTETAQVGVSASSTYQVVPGNMTQFQNAVANVHLAYFSTISRGAFIRSDDTFFTYGGTWTTPANSGFGSGPTIAQSTVNASTVTGTLPANWAGGMVDLFFVGTSDLDTSGCTITLSGTAANASGATTVGGIGWAGQTCPIVIRVKTTGADAGKTIIATFGAGGGGSPQVQFDGWDIEAQYQSPIVCITEPPTMISSFPNAQRLSYLNAGISQAITSWQTAPGGGFPAIGSVTPTGTNVVLADFNTAIVKKSFYLGSDITTGTASSITLVGQRTTSQNDQVAPYVGQYFVVPNGFDGDVGEVLALTSVTSAGNVTIGSLTYPSWTVNVNRNVYSVGGQANANKGTRTYASATSSSTTLTCASLVATDVGAIVTGPGIPNNTTILSVNVAGHTAVCSVAPGLSGSQSIVLTGAPLFDAMWLGPDYVHPGDTGAALIASSVLQAYVSAPNATNFDFVAASSQRWLQGRTNPYPRPLDAAIWQPRGTTGTGNANSNVFATHFYTPEAITVLAMGVEFTAAGTSTMLGYCGIAQDANFGGFPGYTITDFGLQSFSLLGTPGIVGVGASPGTGGSAVSQYLEPGHYWLFFVQFGTGSSATMRTVTTRFDESPMWLPGSTPATGTTIGGIGYLSTTNRTTGGGLVTNINPHPGDTTQWSQVQQGSSIPKMWVYATAGRYSAGNG